MKWDKIETNEEIDEKITKITDDFFRVWTCSCELYFLDY